MNIIHIHAKCEQFEIFEVKPENKAERRLRQIRDLFVKINGNNLVVKTIVINPKMF